MNLPPRPTALVADDEPLLAEGLQSDLAALWPELQVVATVHDGEAALAQALEWRPDVCFLDIRMPGMDGLETARAIVEDWPQHGPALPLLVFATAYEQHALAAFEAQAVDYLVKPVDRERLGRCVARLKGLLDRAQGAAGSPGAHESNDTARLLAQTLEQLRGLAARAAPTPAAPGGRGASGASGVAAASGAAGPTERLSVIQAQVGSTVHLVPVEEVLYFEAADKYVRVVTAEREHLIRLSLRELLPRLDPAVFWQVHRSTVVQARCIASAQREESGIVRLRLRGHKDVLTASRLYAHLFRGM
jgi:DNA-binding LytR/AlgR family response regulator